MLTLKPGLVMTGKVRHRRFAPKAHQFTYPLFMFYFDIGNLAQAFKDIQQVSLERFNWFSYRRKDYLGHTEIPLDDRVRQLVQEKFNCYPQGKIYLLAHLACFGYCFNPVSFYFIFNKNNTVLDYLLMEVTNTPWGEKHYYILPPTSANENQTYQFESKKELHVSPFLAMDYQYQFKLKLGPQSLVIHMENHRKGKKDFDATLILKANSQDTQALKRVFLRHAFITYKIAITIYWQALKLYIKGIRFHTHPKILNK